VFVITQFDITEFDCICSAHGCQHDDFFLIKPFFRMGKVYR
jgi:hypothetical protein